MKQTQQLQLRQSQQLAMTPQLQQSLKMLQMSSAELLESVMEEIEKNPLLALEDPADQPATPDEEISETDHAAPDEEREELAAVDTTRADQFEDQPDTTIDAWEGETSEPSPYRQHNAFEDEESFGSTLTKPITLREHMEQQIMLDIDLLPERLIALQLLDYLDDSGYLSPEYGTVCAQLGCTAEAVEAVLAKLQQMDPPGVFARGLAECLTLQLREKDRFDPAMQALMANLDLIAQADFKKLARLCGVSEEDIRDMCLELRGLNPKPGIFFERSVAESWQPDIFVRRGPDGGWRVELNPDTMPRVLFHRAYYAEITKKTKDKTERKTLTEYAQSANWLVRALDQRAGSMLKVASEIVLMQEEFLERGVYHIKPMTLKAVAERVGLHESTVGRVVNSKYMATPKGVFEFKYFFSSAVGGGDATNGEDLSSHTIKHIIREMIENENPGAVLSDDAIAGLIKAKGMEVARRTIAKYRESMHIPSSADRRRTKKIQAAANG